MTIRQPQSSWINREYDKPAGMSDSELHGTVGYRLAIENGRVKECQITKSSGNAALDAYTCATITKRARFNPALNDAGDPLPGSFADVFSWSPPKPLFFFLELARRHPAPPPPELPDGFYFINDNYNWGHPDFVLDVSATGHVTGCRVMHVKLPVEAEILHDRDVAICAVLTAEARFEPARGDHGEPVAQSYRNESGAGLQEIYRKQ